MAQAVARALPRLQGEHGQAVQIRAFAKHAARLGPGAIEQHKQRALAAGAVRGNGACVAGKAGQHPLGRHVVTRKHHHRLPLRVGQQGQQIRVHGGARPAKGKGVGHHVGDQPAGVAGLERLDIAHQQAHARARGHGRAQGAQAVAGQQAAACAALAARATARQKGLGTARQALGALARDGMGNHRRHSHGHRPPAHSSSNSGTSDWRLSHTPPPSSVKPSCRPRRYSSARWRNRRGSVRSSSRMSRS